MKNIFTYQETSLNIQILKVIFQKKKNQKLPKIKSNSKFSQSISQPLPNTIPTRKSFSKLPPFYSNTDPKQGTQHKQENTEVFVLLFQYRMSVLSGLMWAEGRRGTGFRWGLGGKGGNAGGFNYVKSNFVLFN